MSVLGLAAPTSIRCQWRPVASPCRASLRPWGLDMDYDPLSCAVCGARFTSTKAVGRHVSGNPRCKFPPEVARARALARKTVARRARGQFPRKPKAVVTRAARVLPTLEERFWAKVDRSAGPNACWPWIGVRIPSGYGQLWRDGRHRPATHIALGLAGRMVPAGMLVCHTCDNPPCVNPSHLFVGTNGDNAKDAQSKDRLGRLTNDQVRAIRREAAAGVPRYVSAERHGVAPSTVSNILAGRSRVEVMP